MLKIRWMLKIEVILGKKPPFFDAILCSTGRSKRFQKESEFVNAAGRMRNLPEFLGT